MNSGLSASMILAVLRSMPLLFIDVLAVLAALTRSSANVYASPPNLRDLRLERREQRPLRLHDRPAPPSRSLNRLLGSIEHFRSLRGPVHRRIRQIDEIFRRHFPVFSFLRLSLAFGVDGGAEDTLGVGVEQERVGDHVQAAGDVVVERERRSVQIGPTHFVGLAHLHSVLLSPNLNGYCIKSAPNSSRDRK